MDKLFNETNERYCKAANGEGKFYLKTYFVDEPKAVAVILHDLISHGKRYEELAEALNKEKIDVLLPDITGFGMSKQGHPGAFAMKNDGLKFVQRDIERLFNIYDNEKGILPHILISDGKTNVISSLFTMNYKSVDALILMGYMQHFNVSSAMLAAAKSFVMMSGYHSVSNALINMTEAPASQGRGELNKYYWISSLEEEIYKFIEDENCGLPLTASAYLEIFSGEKLTNKAKWIAKFPNLPVLFLAGADDMMGNYGKSARDMANNLWDSYHDLVSINIYSGCRHDLLHDSRKNSVIKDILNWINDLSIDIDNNIKNDIDNEAK